ncbi:glycerol-3-phosphate acyltransferase 2, mitochondrial-like [Porphyrio hochstetteri]
MNTSEEPVEISIPLLGTLRPLLRRCCQTCTPCSWGQFYWKDLNSLGFLDVGRVTERDTRYRGWLVRRVCGLLAVCSWEVPADTPADLPARVCRSTRVRGSRRDGESQQQWQEKALRTLAEIQAPLSCFTLRLCSWALLKLLDRLFISVQLHEGQLEMVLRAARTPEVPLVFLSRHRSQLDGLLLSLLLFSRGLGVPRVTVGDQPCSPGLRALLQRLGGIFLPSGMEQTPSGGGEGLPGAVLATYVEEVLRSRQPLLIFLEEPREPGRLSAPARQWLVAVCGALRGRVVPDVLMVPVGIAYELLSGPSPQDEGGSARPLGLGSCLWAAARALRPRRGCARLDLGQPFSLWEFVDKTLPWQGCAWNLPAELLQPSILGPCPDPLASQATEVAGPDPLRAAALGAEEELLVTRLGLHCLSDSVAHSAITAVEITSALLLYRHWEGVFISRLMKSFSMLLEEILRRQHNVGFSGELFVLVHHSLGLLRPHLTAYRVGSMRDVLLIPKDSAEARRELGRHSAAILPVFASEVVGAGAIHALLVEVVPFLQPTWSLQELVFSYEELCHKILELLQLLPPNLLGFQPCQPIAFQSDDIVDKLLLCGLLESEEPEGQQWGCDLVDEPRWKKQIWDSLDFDSDISSGGAVVRKRCFKLSEPEGFPGFLLFLWRLLRPVLSTLGRAVAFLERPCWPQHETAYVEGLLQFLAEEDSFDPPTRSLALSSLQSFKKMGINMSRGPVLEEERTPAGPLLHLAQPFRCSARRKELEASILQFFQPGAHQ